MTLHDLEAAVRTALDSADISPVDARVARFPDARTLRWYQSIGVMDRPLRYDGRVAIYGPRHVLQATAAKLLQARGLSLSQVQGALRGATDAQLRAALDDERVSIVPSPRPAVAGSWRTVQLAPGVLLTIDATVVSDPAELANRLIAQLHPGESI